MLSCSPSELLCVIGLFVCVSMCMFVRLLMACKLIVGTGHKIKSLQVY